jgi:hypothetical protein
MNNVQNVRAIKMVLCTTALSACATLDLDAAPQSVNEYRYTLSSGLFSLPHGARSVDWAIVNNSISTQKFRVTVYRTGTSEKVPLAPGPITNTLEPLHSSHNANGVGSQKPFTIGRDFEVVLEVNSLRVLPSVEVWIDRGNTVIPGTLIGPGQFVDISN